MKTILFLIIFFFNIYTGLSAQEEPVVCLHGFFRSYKCMIPLGHSLRNEGFKVYLWDYRSRSKTIEKHAHDLVEVLNAIARQYPGEPIHFITHSLGGVIVRAAVNHPLCPREAKIGKAILLAPPNKGAGLARRFNHCAPIRWIFGKNAGRQLLTYDEDEMNSFGQFPESMEVTILSGTKKSRFSNKWIQKPNDGKVSVDETCINTPHYHFVHDVSHSWIMTSRQTIRLAKSYLMFGTFD